MRRGFIQGLIFALAWAIPAHAADPDLGAKVFKKCKACHQVGEGAKNRSGPILNEIIGAPIAGNDSFRYSKTMKAAGADGGLWTVEALDAFLTNPKKYIPKTRMSFKGLKNADDRANVIAFLESHTHHSIIPPAFAVAPEILAIPGDVEYGEYLANECTSCHQASGASDGIPAITGLDSASFVTAMHSYRAGAREHQVMQMITGRLNDEEIAALAAYFEAQE